MERFARAEVGQFEDADAPSELPDEIDLPFPLWVVKRAWARDKAHGQLPHGGALLTLPMAWYRALDTVYARYDVIFERIFREKYPEGGAHTPINGKLGEDFDDLFDVAAGEARGGWNDLTKG